MVLGPKFIIDYLKLLKNRGNEKVVDTDFPIEDKFEKLNLNKNNIKKQLPFNNTRRL